MYATRQKKVKTDKRDARALAQALKLGAYKPAHRLSDAQRVVRLALDVRQTLVETRTKLINQIGAILLGQGYRVASGGAEQFERRLLRLELPAALRAQLAPLCTLLGPLNAQIAAQEAELEARADGDPEAQRLRTVPGVGPLTALMFLAVIDGATRFDNVRQVHS